MSSRRQYLCTRCNSSVTSGAAHTCDAVDQTTAYKPATDEHAISEDVELHLARRQAQHSAAGSFMV
jgi:hypothetical protein